MAAMTHRGVCVDESNGGGQVAAARVVRGVVPDGVPVGEGDQLGVASRSTGGELFGGVGECLHVAAAADECERDPALVGGDDLADGLGVGPAQTRAAGESIGWMVEVMAGFPVSRSVVPSSSSHTFASSAMA
jgi:hypothetical protein